MSSDGSGGNACLNFNHVGVVNLIVMSTAAAPRAITVSEGLLRREAVENARADLRLEGLAPTADAQLLFEQFVQGDLTEEQLVNAILAR
jgi:hypothetical protein